MLGPLLPAVAQLDAMLCAFLCCALVQVVERREEVDWKRHGVFVTFGFFYLVSSTQ